MKSIPALLVIAAALSASGFAHAQAEFYRSVIPPGVQQGGVAGAVLLAGREYQGSDESRLQALPSVDYQAANGFFAGVLNGVGFNASRRPDRAYGLRVTADFGRKERRSSALQGLGDVDARPELGAFFNLSPTRHLTLSSSVRYGSGNDRKGALVDLGASWSAPLGPDLRWGTSLAATWSNARYASEYFGIDAVQAVRSGYARFTPDAGWRDVRLGTSLTYRMAPAWSLTGVLTYSDLQGDARRSPIVREKGTVSAVLALGYSF